MQALITSIQEAAAEHDATTEIGTETNGETFIEFAGQGVRYRAVQGGVITLGTTQEGAWVYEDFRPLSDDEIVTFAANTFRPSRRVPAWKRRQQASA